MGRWWARWRPAERRAPRPAAAVPSLAGMGWDGSGVRPEGPLPDARPPVSVVARLGADPAAAALRREWENRWDEF